MQLSPAAFNLLHNLAASSADAHMPDRYLAIPLLAHSPVGAG
jgi:hypothetical protein